MSWVKLKAYAFDTPITYKTLTIYPVTMENFFEFKILVQSLLLEKNTTIEGISKSYLEYLYSLHQQGDKEQNLMRFDALLKLCLRDETIDIRYWMENKKAIFKIKNEVFDSRDFDEIRNIICEQNSEELPDETIQKEIRDSMLEARRMRAKLENIVPPSLEDQVVCIMASTNLKPEEIAKISIRKFGQLIYRVNAKLHYEIYLTASLSGMVTFKDKSILKHWMAGEEVDKWKDTMISVESVKDKLNFNDKKKK